MAVPPQGESRLSVCSSVKHFAVILLNNVIIVCLHMFLIHARKIKKSYCLKNRTVICLMELLIALAMITLREGEIYTTYMSFKIQTHFPNYKCQ